MPTIRLDEGVSIHCAVDDYLWPWEKPTSVLMMHGFARNATFCNRWVPAIADTRRIYRPDLLGCGASDVPTAGYRDTPEKIEAQILAVLDALSLSRVHWVGESSGGSKKFSRRAWRMAGSSCLPGMGTASTSFNRNAVRGQRSTSGAR